MTSPLLHIGGRLLLLVFLGSVVQSSTIPKTLTDRKIIMDNGIASRNEDNWSKKWDMCPSGMRATGFALKTENYQGPRADDTSVNGIVLLCGDGKNRITSEQTRYGQWAKDVKCPNDYFITSFQSGFDAPKDTNNGQQHDQIGLDDLRFLCVPPNRMLDDRVIQNVVQPRSRQNINGYRQYWTAWSDRCTLGICGINTQVDPRAKAAGVDVIGINDVRFVCC